MASTRALRRRVAERVDQVAIGSGEDELGAALANVLDVVDQATGAGRETVGVADVLAAMRRGLD